MAKKITVMLNDKIMQVTENAFPLLSRQFGAVRIEDIERPSELVKPKPPELLKAVDLTPEELGETVKEPEVKKVIKKRIRRKKP